MACSKSELIILLSSASMLFVVLCKAPGIHCTDVSEQKESSEARLSYSTLEDLGIACSPLDTCSLPRTDDDLLHYNCECGDHCTRFKTCCVDSPFPRDRSTTNYRESCVQMPNHVDPMFMIARCSKDWSGGHLVRLMCEETMHNLSDPFRLRPVTSPSKQVTYKNGFCALCNNDKGDLIPWSVTGETDIPLINADMDNLVYDQETDTWRVQDEIGQGKSVFVPLRIKFNVPDHLSSLVRYCQADLVSSCASTWTESDTKTKCDDYMASISSTGPGPQLSFRNMHCAFCNHVTNLTGFTCLLPAAKRFLARPISFAILLDVNKSDGNIVGRTNICKEKEVYDPFFKKCRTLSCFLPGYVVKDDKCVPGET